MNPVAVLPSKDVSRLASRDDVSLSVEPNGELVYGAAVASTGPMLAVSATLVLAGFGISVAVLLARRNRHLTPQAAFGTMLEQAHPGWSLWSNERERSDASGASRPARAHPRPTGAHRGADVSILVAVLGEPTAVADVNPVLRSTRGRLREVVLARPVGVDEAHPRWDEAKQAATRTLSQAALFVFGSPPWLVPVPGQGEQAIASFAAANPVAVVILVGDPHAKPDLYRRPELWGCTIVVVSPPSEL
jgi:hypothetical protein